MKPATKTTEQPRHSSDERFRGFNFARVNLFMLGFICLLLAGAALKLTTPVVLPFVIAVLLTFVLEPIIYVLEKIKIPRAIGAVVIVLVLGVGVYLVGAILFTSLRTIISLYPKYELRFTEIYIRVAIMFNLPYNEHLSLFQNLWTQLDLGSRIQAIALSSSEAFLNFLGNAVMVTLFVVFLLLEMGHFRDRVELAFEGKLSSKIQVIISSTVTQVARYLSTKFVISLATGILVWFNLVIIDMDFPVVWGVIAFILNFIPNIGSIACGGGITLFALVQFWPDPTPIIIAAAGVTGINMLLGNILEPKIMGDNLGLSPFVVLVSLLLWGWLWGFTGLIVAVPMTVIVKIICENIPILEPVSILLGSYKAAKLKELAIAVPAEGPTSVLTTDSSRDPGTDQTSSTRQTANAPGLADMMARGNKEDSGSKKPD
ncbi:MAG: AI-2E family transporter [Spirochaetia bacterium]|nr:AI-2E family transporter [Spirochaetia bacterium]